MFFLLLLVIQVHLFDLVHSEVCNPTECFGMINKVFQDFDGKDSCEKMANIERCVDLCYPEAKVNGILKGIEEVKHETCKHDQDNKLHNKCVDEHKYLLLSCLYESFNINSVHADANPRLLMCRKITEAEHCDLSTLVTCSQHSNYVAEVLLEKLFQPLHIDYCTFTPEEIYKLNITYPVFANDYKNLALCFDANSHLIDKCVSDKGAKNIVVGSIFSYKLCKTVDSFLNCLQDIVQKRCNNQEATFKMISHSLYQIVLPKCFPYSNSNKASKGKLLNDKYMDAFGSSSKNSSGNVKVHQHIEELHSGSDKTLTTFSLSSVVLYISAKFCLNYLLIL